MLSFGGDLRSFGKAGVEEAVRKGMRKASQVVPEDFVSELALALVQAQDLELGRHEGAGW